MAELTLIPTRPTFRIWKIVTWLLLALLLLAILGLTALVAWAEQTATPTTLAPAGATELVIVGGLKRPFPPMVSHPDNPTTPDRVNLGKLLYFDPILSGDNTVACATCHHP